MICLQIALGWYKQSGHAQSRLRPGLPFPSAAQLDKVAVSIL